jgi:hypothetical protein
MEATSEFTSSTTSEPDSLENGDEFALLEQYLIDPDSFDDGLPNDEDAAKIKQFLPNGLSSENNRVCIHLLSCCSFFVLLFAVLFSHFFIIFLFVDD